MFKESHLSVCQVKRMAEQLCKDTAQRKGKGRKGRTNSPRVQVEIFFFFKETTDPKKQAMGSQSIEIHRNVTHQ
jgi:hypothetical protein